MRRYIVFGTIAIMLGALVAPFAFAAEPSTIKFTPQISIPGTDIQAGQTINIDGSTIGRYIIALYTFGVYAAGIVATVTLMAAGFVWLMAGGNSSQVEQAKTMIRGALTGYVLLLVSWVLLNTINPNLTEFRSLDIEPVKPVALVVDKTYSACCSCESGAGIQGCNEVVVTYSGTCECPDRPNVSIDVPSHSACKSFGDECEFTEGSESSQRQRALADCQARGPSLGQICTLKGSDKTCQTVNECRAVLVENGQAGACRAGQCAAGYSCNRAFSCDPEDINDLGTLLTSDQSSTFYSSNCCKPLGQIGDPCYTKPNFTNTSYQSGGDCASNLTCTSSDDDDNWVFVTSTVGTCQVVNN